MTPRFVGVVLLSGIAAVAACGDDDTPNATTNARNDGGLDGGSNEAGGDGGNPIVTTPLTPGWTNAKIGGGGFVTGGQVAADGTKFFRTDTSGGYLYDDADGNFIQVIPRNLPAEANTFWNGTGVFEAMIAGSNSKVLYAAYQNALYRSTDGGNSFTAVKSDLQFEANGGGLRTLERHGQMPAAVKPSPRPAANSSSPRTAVTPGRIFRRADRTRRRSRAITTPKAAISCPPPRPAISGATPRTSGPTRSSTAPTTRRS